MKKASNYPFDDSNSNSNGSISNRNGSRTVDNGSSNTNIAPRVKKKPVAKINMKTEFSGESVVLYLPLQTVSEANSFEHWRKKHDRHLSQQKTVTFALKPLREKIKLPCKILLTRLAPKELDPFDNLPMSFKYIVDAVCAIITGDFRPGKADGDKRIKISCDQIKSKEYGVIVEITF